jgi:Na+/H+ antiporter NhaD/arsenite permease-like protein
LKLRAHWLRNVSVAAAVPALLLLASLLIFAQPAIADSPMADSSLGESEGHGAQAHPADAEHGDAHTLGRELSLWWVIPFAGILLSIAFFPLFAPKFWHSHFPKISAFWAVVFAVPFLLVYQGAAWFHILEIYLIDYFPFIILLWGLFTVSGGILVRGTLKGTPQLNLIFLLIGTALASWIGTTGASMVLIRPVLRANADRKHKVHIIIFFIFLVSNIGGSLTPLGDPPLFLGFLHSVPFFWTFNLIAPMGFLALILLALFFLVDWFYYRRETIESFEPVPLKIEGLHNSVFLLGIIGAVLMSGLWKAGQIQLLGVPLKIESILRDFIIIFMGLLSLQTTGKLIHKDNEFTWFPIKEVAYLFAGIFMTIIPALAILKAGEEGALAGLMASLKTPAHYFWVTGLLSSFLDNAPTYLTFFNTALGEFAAGLPEPQAVETLISQQEIYLKAISCGAVFMGANTYIGNAPNFMVRSIAEEAGIRMPSFFGYMLKYSLPILIPIFFLITFVFFS